MWNRRQWLQRSAQGIGWLALADLMQREALGGATSGIHHPATATNVIFLYMDGGPSQVDTFDPKPLLDRYHGEDPAGLFQVS
ncbi:MAG: DUF1501 domain-containing protein, partial [Pirellulaceae bacterium]